MSEPTWARKKAAEIVGSVYWRGGAHPSAKEFLLVERIAAALVKERARKPAPHMKLSQRDAKTFVEAAMSEHKHTFPVDAACDCGAMISEVCHDLQRQLAEAQAQDEIHWKTRRTLLRKLEIAHERDAINRKMRAYVAFVLTGNETADSQLAADQAKQELTEAYAAIRALLATIAGMKTEHHGDCTKEPQPCIRCQADDGLFLEKHAAAIRRASEGKG